MYETGTLAASSLGCLHGGFDIGHSDDGVGIIWTNFDNYRLVHTILSIRRYLEER